MQAMARKDSISIRATWYDEFSRARIALNDTLFSVRRDCWEDITSISVSWRILEFVNIVTNASLAESEQVYL